MVAFGANRIGIHFGYYYRAMTDEELFDRAEIVHRLAHAHENFGLNVERLKKTIAETPWLRPEA
jgi:hypothetical protein